MNSTKLKIYNTLTRKKEEFIPLNPKSVGLYVCGPTVYDFAHIGNARPVVVFDVLTRLLRQLYPKVTYVRNITDVDDKINAASAATGEPIDVITQRTTQAYNEDMAALGAFPPDITPRATHHIPEMIHMIQLLIEKGHAYEVQGHVLFSVATDPQYGQLSRRNREELIAGARVEIAPYKNDPADFVLWKPSDSTTPGWESPWGRGRPGWHIECSAMGQKYLGKIFDIHGGGIDLLFPHHENEVAQSCCANDTKNFAMYWMHNGHLTVNGEKMSKSLGNFFTVRDLLKDHSGEVLRLFLLMSHYRQPIDLTKDLLYQSKNVLDRFYGSLRLAFESIKDEAVLDGGVMDDGVREALLDDLNVPMAITILHDIASQIYKESCLEKKIALARTLKASGETLGILQQNPAFWCKSGGGGALEISEMEIIELIEQRNQARKSRDFQTSDRIRLFLLEKKVVLEDGLKETSWRRE